MATEGLGVLGLLEYASTAYSLMAMAREPVFYRLLDVLGQLVCVVGALGSTLGAVEAADWLSRILYGVMAVTLGAFVLRATPVFWRSWHGRAGSPPGPLGRVAAADTAPSQDDA